jgi:hypothetical protein
MLQSENTGMVGASTKIPFKQVIMSKYWPPEMGVCICDLSFYPPPPMKLAPANLTNAGPGANFLGGHIGTIFCQKKLWVEVSKNSM